MFLSGVETALDLGSPAMVDAGLARSFDRARERGPTRPFRRNRWKGLQGSRCNAGAAPATV